MTTIHTTCKIGACEPFCGVEVDVDEVRMAAVRPDNSHPISKVRLYQRDACPRLSERPRSVIAPMKRPGSGWKQVSWGAAASEIGRKLRDLQDAHGPRPIATYWGNARDSTVITLANTFCSSLGSPNSFNVLSLEYTDRGAVAEATPGNENFILQPKSERSDLRLSQNPPEVPSHVKPTCSSK